MAAEAQLKRWAAEHPTAPQIGKVFEVPPSYILPRVAAGIAAAGALWYLNSVLYYKPPESFKPEFLEEQKKIGDVAQRVNGSPVFLNPFRNRIPGSILGPEDAKND